MAQQGRGRAGRGATDGDPADTRYIVGVDLGGTNIVFGAMTVDGTRQFAMHTVPTHAELGADGVVGRIVEGVERVIAETRATTGAARERFLGVGIGSPGPLDRERGIVIVTPNLGWRDFPLRDRVQDGVKLPATLDNDANCATLGEWWIGAAKGARHVVGLTIGTGIGGGLILDGKLYHGASDVAGEPGHATIDSTGRRCKCGNYGCLEAYASGPAIAERAREALAGGEPSILPQMVGGDLARITAATIYDAAQQLDALSVQVVRDTARFLGTGIANLLNIFNPEVVVLAGGVTQAGEALFEPLRAEVRRRAFKPAVDACRIVPGILEGNAGVVGAVGTFAQWHGLM
ncbi:MAG: ROK family protein [Gemmatimonadota bacterium]|nr:ROK family protein [Gemmatimonadota bacterium]